ncbi:MAG: T9SS type A sorting domain-containing protein [Bacteroidia bacterium]
MKYSKWLFFILVQFQIMFAQNLVVDGGIVNSNANWNGQEAPWSAGTYQNSYLTACGQNYVMEVDAASQPLQVVSGFESGADYVITFVYAYRQVGCGPSVNPTTLRIQFTDATGVLNQNLSIANTVNQFTSYTYSFTNNASTSHTLQFTNPGNANTCGVILDNISITRVSSPGGVGSGNLALWYKTETISQTNASDVYGWISQETSAITVTAPCAARPVYRTGLASNADNLIANFNPYITFNGTSQYLGREGSNIALFDAASSASGGSFFSAYRGGGTAGRNYFGHRSNSTSSRIDAEVDGLVIVDGGTAGTSNGISYTQNAQMNIISAKGKNDGMTLNDLNGTTQSTSNSSTNGNRLVIGARANGSSTIEDFFNSSLSEIILFNTMITDAQMHQVRSYLAAKYGVTLNDNSSTGAIDERSYIASDGSTVMWDYTANSGYHNNVTIIGKDNGSGWNQIRSISTDADAGSNTGLAMLDINNVSAISSNNSFLSVGHNGITIPNPGGANFSDVPSGIQSRLNRVWKFQKTGTGIAANVSVRFNMTGFSPLTGSDLRLLVSTTPVFSGATIISGSYAAPYFTASLPTTGGVYFTVASINQTTTPLPVELVDFSTEYVNSYVSLNWKTASEFNSSHFEIERSTDGINFVRLANVASKAVNGNSSTSLTYYLNDDDLQEAGYYYRIKQVDLDGTYKYSDILFIRIFSSAINIYPNPGNGKFWIRVKPHNSIRHLELLVTNELGQEIISQDFTLNDEQLSNLELEVMPDKPLPKGIYFAKINTNGGSYHYKLVVN